MSSQLKSRAAFESSFFGFLYRQVFLHRRPLPAGTSVCDQTAIVTGSNIGLGFEAARQLLQLGLDRLIMAVRSLDRGNVAAQKLQEEFLDSNIDVWQLDLEDHGSIQAFVGKCESLDRIDMVILNAGVRLDTFQVVPSTGRERGLQVNYISTALLAVLLLPVLKTRKRSSARPPVLSVVTSETAYWARVNDETPILAQFEKYPGSRVVDWYDKEKLLQQLFVVKLAEQISSEDVVINLVNPGLCQGTAINRSIHHGLPLFMMSLFTAILGRSVEAGASTYIDAVTVKGKNSHGGYLSDWAIKPYPPLLYTETGTEVKERLWAETMEVLSFAGAAEIVQHMRRA